jgi:hypothetical protein
MITDFLAQVRVGNPKLICRILALGWRLVKGGTSRQDCIPGLKRPNLSTKAEKGCSKQMRRMPEVPLRYVLKRESQWIGRQRVASGNEYRLFCLCGEVSQFDRVKLRRYVVSVAVFRPGLSRRTKCNGGPRGWAIVRIYLGSEVLWPNAVTNVATFC